MNLSKKAKAILNIYKSNPNIDTVFIGGSVSRDWQDAYSDIEIFVFWRKAPTVEERKNPIVLLGGEIIDFFPYEDEEWSETYISKGVKLEISNFLTETINKVIEDVVLSFDTNPVKQCLLAAIYDGVSLSDDSVMEILKKKVRSYPTELRIAMVKENLYMGTKWNNREALLHRKDWLMLYQTIAEVQTNLMRILFGLNRQFIHHPSFKWQRHSLESMDIIPKDISDRFDSIFMQKPEIAVKQLDVVIKDVYELIQQELPQIDVTKVKEKSLFLRPLNQ
ncbi:DUF4037 domain-containing protein [Terribacillus saccharophilus]|uniref:DUF4037 domain-containing protein n=1 Tax=Terribacillus saccharophilus TaxID=361277 RepID=UPI001595FC12|nr:DUF4037 domain-containing protein [Terribacillus saccharophilus]